MNRRGNSQLSSQNRRLSRKRECGTEKSLQPLRSHKDSIKLMEDNSDDEFLHKQDWIMPSSPEDTKHSFTFPTAKDSQKLQIFETKKGQRMLVGSVMKSAGQVKCSKCYYNRGGRDDAREAPGRCSIQEATQSDLPPRASPLNDNASSASDPDFGQYVLVDHDQIRTTTQTEKTGEMTQLNYHNMNEVNAFVRQRLECLTGPPRKELCMQIMLLAEPFQRRDFPYQKQRQPTEAFPPWWPDLAGLYESPCRMKDDVKYELLTFFIMVPYRAPELRAKILQMPPAKGSASPYPSWKALLQKAFSKCQWRKKVVKEAAKEADQTGETKDKDRMSEQIEKWDIIITFLLKVAGDVEAAMTNGADATQNRCIETIPETIRHVAYGHKSLPKKNNKRTPASSSTPANENRSARKISKTETSNDVHQPPQTPQSRRRARNLDFRQIDRQSSLVHYPQSSFPQSSSPRSYFSQSSFEWHPTEYQQTQNYHIPHRAAQTEHMCIDQSIMHSWHPQGMQDRVPDGPRSQYPSSSLRLTNSEVQHADAMPFVPDTDTITTTASSKKSSSTGFDSLRLPAGSTSDISSQTGTFSPNVGQFSASTSFLHQSPGPGFGRGEDAPGVYPPDLVRGGMPALVPDFKTAVNNEDPFANVLNTDMINIDPGQWAPNSCRIPSLAFNLEDMSQDLQVPLVADTAIEPPNGTTKHQYPDQHFGVTVTEDGSAHWVTEEHTHRYRGLCRCYYCIHNGFQAPPEGYVPLHLRRE